MTNRQTNRLTDTQTDTQTKTTKTTKAAIGSETDRQKQKKRETVMMRQTDTPSD